MINNKHINVIISVLIILTLLFTSVITLIPGFLPVEAYDITKEKQYETKLFSDDLMTVDIKIDKDDFQKLLDNAKSEQYYTCDVEVNGEIFSNVGIRAKGNTSLSQIAQDSTTDRYSFKIEFDHYVSDNSCYGLDKLVLNNNYADSTYLKEYLVYDMYEFLDADSSLCTFADVSINGEEWGLYLALEGVEESFAQRNYGSDYGKLYKPENMGVGGAGKMNNFATADIDGLIFGNDDKENAGKAANSMEDTDETANEAQNTAKSDNVKQGTDNNSEMQNTQSDTQTADDNTTQNGAMQQGPGFQGGGMGGKGSNLVYSDDNLESYSTIWDGAIFDSTDEDHQRVVTALQKLSLGEELESYIDVDAVLKYLAVHTFSVNLDSLSGNMAHNYYLYEKDGKLSMIPWDYNLAFGGFQSGSASAVVNFPIDTPVTGASIEERPIFSKLLEVEEYKEIYHNYLSKLVNEYVGNGNFEVLYTKMREIIDDKVKNDPTAFYTYEEYDKGAEMLKNLIYLRAESISGQLDGSLPSTTEGQNIDNSSLVDASSITLSVMGVMNGGGGGMGGNMGGGPNFQSNRTQTQTEGEFTAAKNENAAESTDNTTSQNGENQTARTAGTQKTLTQGAENGGRGAPPPRGQMPGNRQQGDSQSASSQGTQDQTQSQTPNGEESTAEGITDNQAQNSEFAPPDFPENQNFQNKGEVNAKAGTENSTGYSNSAVLTILISIFILGAAIAGVIIYKRRRFKV